MQLEGTVAIVTGGNGGLGQRICHALAKAGSDVVVVYSQSREDAREPWPRNSKAPECERRQCHATSPIHRTLKNSSRA